MGVMGVSVSGLPQSFELSTNLANYLTPILLPVSLQVSSIFFLFSFLKKGGGDE